MLCSKIIQESAEIDQFSRLYFAASRGHKPVERSYLLRSTVRVFFRLEKPSEWLGGYVINTHPPFRYFVVFDEIQKGEIMSSHQIGEGDISEVTCIWIRGRYLIAAERLQVYLKSMLDAFTLGKPYIFGGSTEPGTVKLQKRIMPRDFHQGVALVGDQETSYWIYYVGRLESVFTMLRFVTTEFLRTKLKTKSQRRRPTDGKTGWTGWVAKFMSSARNFRF